MKQLLKVQAALQNNNNQPLLKTLETNLKKFQAIKTEYQQFKLEERLNLLEERLVLFLLATATNHQDHDFAVALINQHQLLTQENTPVKLALGRYFFSVNLFKKTTDYLLPLFNPNPVTANSPANPLNSADLQKLCTALFEVAMLKEAEDVLKYALKTYAGTKVWGMELIKYQVNTAHLLKYDPQEIINNLNIMGQEVSTFSELQDMAQCYYKAGYYQQSFNMYDRLLAMVTPKKLLPANRAIFNSEATLESLHEIMAIIKGINKQSFLIAGTLLGLERDGRLFDHDKDADIGLFVEDYNEIYTIVSAICEHKNLIAPDMYKQSKDFAQWNIAIHDVARSSAVDLFFFYKKDTHYENGIHTNCGIIKWQFAPFEIIETTLAGRQYPVPSNYQQGHLTELYGDWQETVIVWESLINCPNLAPESQIPVIYYALGKLVAAIGDKSLKKFDNLYNNLTQRWHFQFTPQATANLKKVRTELERMESRSTL